MSLREIAVIDGNVFCEDGIFRKTSIRIQGEYLADIGEVVKEKSVEVVDATDCYVVPGFVDIHIHGAVGVDFCDASAKAIEKMATYLLSQGVTSFLGTTMTLPAEDLLKVCEAAKPLVGFRDANQATLQGINMEGPFFNIEKRGAQNQNHIIAPDLALYREMNKASGDGIKTMAIAPEIPGGLSCIKEVSKECIVSLAHSSANYQAAMAGFEAGATHVTHLFNGMPPFNHREPSIVGAALDAKAYVEVICDGIHLHPAVIRAVFRLFDEDKVCLISDAMSACGMADGRYELGGQVVTVQGNSATIANGSLAGSVTSLMDGFRNAVSFGIPLEKALKAATINPAKSVQIDHLIGSIGKGKYADLLLLDKQLQIKKIIKHGKAEPSCRSLQNS